MASALLLRGAPRAEYCKISSGLLLQLPLISNILHVRVSSRLLIIARISQTRATTRSMAMRVIMLLARVRAAEAEGGSALS